MRLFQSNQMTGLANVFCERNTGLDAQSDPFEPLTVVVQSLGIGQWLKLQLAARTGIAANVDCVLPATYLWRLYRQLIPETAQLSESPFDRDRLTWRIMRILDANPGLSGAVSNYLDGSGDRDLRLLQLSNELAGLFDEYLMYRPAWILDWQAGRREMHGHEAWQATLWQLLLSDLSGYEHLHRAALHRTLVEKIGTGAPLPGSRLSVFGLSSMPPLQLETFAALSTRMNVDVYFLNPCEHYWGDIVSPRDMARRSIRNLIGKDDSLLDEDYLETGNPLLSSLGKQGREYFELLLESPAVQSEENFVRNSGGHALAFVQNDILDLAFGGEFGGKPPSVRRKVDHSIQVHVCHSPMREVEVLRDEILRSIDTDPTLRPSDIIVMVPEISHYAPYIHAVFTGDIPYRIADQTALGSSPLLAGFLSLLELPVARITATEMMDLLEMPAIMRRFELVPEDLDTLSYWISETGIRWEIDGTEKASNWGLPDEQQNSWRFGLDRLLLGFAMSGEQGPWQDTLPFEISAADTILLGKLGLFIDQIRDCRQRLRQPGTATEWLQRIIDLTADFFEPRGDETLTISQVLQAAEQVTGRASAAAYRAPFSREAFTFAMRQALDTEPANAALISGGITFANLVPMRSIPFRMVCLLGMNDGDYPRDRRPHSFDLIAAGHHQRGDRSRKLDDRYLFLEALLSARDRFLVSHVGRGIRDNQEKPPSVVMAELLSYLEAVFEDFTPTVHALQPFNARYYRGDETASYNPLWFTPGTGQTPAPAFLPAPLPPDPALQEPGLADLAGFFRHPGRYFMQQRLGVYLDSLDNNLKDVETFEPDHLERYQLADQALEALLTGRDINTFSERVMMSGTLLPGPLGEQHLSREINRATNVYEVAREYRVQPLRDIRTGLDLGDGRQLTVALDNLHGDTLLRFRVGTESAKDRLQTWLAHLGANSVAAGIRSVFVSRNNRDEARITSFAPINSDLAREHLRQLLTLYEQGCCEPLFLPPDASNMLMVELSRDESPDRALARTKQRWLGETRDGAEKDDRYWQRLFAADGFDEVFAQRAQSIWRPLLDAIDAGGAA